MKNLFIDIETFSPADLKRTGVYPYSEHGNFEILLFGYSVDGEPVQVVDLTTGETIPGDILNALTDDSVTKWAFNANFERVCLSNWLKKNYPERLRERYLSPSSWRCHMVWSAYLGLPLSLEGAGAVLKLEDQKLSEGKELIRYFCVPCAPTISNGGRTRNLPMHAPEKWELFKKYNCRDVEVEVAIHRRLENFPVPEFVWDEYALDQEINDRGIAVDMRLVEQAICFDERSRNELSAKMRQLTELENPNSVSQMKTWLADKGLETDTLGKKAVAELLKDAPEGITPVLALRQQLAKSSVKKYQAMKNVACADNRARGCFQFYGGNRTGRWCLTGDHEVLTRNGWVRLDQWQGGSIACWNANSEVVSFQKANALCFDYSGAMYTYHDARIDQCSTPDHRMRVKRRYDAGWEDMTVEEMAGYRPCIPVADPMDWRKPMFLHEIKGKPVISEYSGKVYCAETTTGYFLVRRNGKVWVTGNSGRTIQLQNLPQNHLDDLEEARTLVKAGDYDAVQMLYGDVPDTLSQLIRTAFVPKSGYKFIVADFSAIEARVLSFLAGEQWRNELFARGGDIYCQSASEMFKVPVVKNGVNGHLRQKGKVAELACIAEGSLVLTDTGLVPIEDVSTDMKLWDGENWVEHQGVIFKGEREVITYDGLTATPDHLVWTEGETRPVPLGLAAASGAHLRKTGDGRRTVWMGENHLSGETLEFENESLLCADEMHRVRVRPMAGTGQSQKREVKGMPKLFSAEADTEVAAQTSYCSKTTMRKSFVPRLSQLWRKRNNLRLFQRNRSGGLLNQNIWTSRENDGNRQNRHKWKLCTGQSTLCKSFSKLYESAEERTIQVFSRVLALFLYRCNTKALKGINQRGNNQGCGRSGVQKTKKLENHQREARLYDIRNAGPYHRFTVSDCLVHNCGYGGSVGALKAMGALEMGLEEDELQPLVKSWRAANPNIVKFWWDVDTAVKNAVFDHTETRFSGLRFFCRSGMLFIELPSGRRLAYVKPKLETNRFWGQSVTYMGAGGQKKWERLESYGPKFTENIVQAVSRDILAHAMKSLRELDIVAHVHDEVIIECTKETSLEEVCERMGQTPPWIEGLILRADGYECGFYKKS